MKRSSKIGYNEEEFISLSKDLKKVYDANFYVCLLCESVIVAFCIMNKLLNTDPVVLFLGVILFVIQSIIFIRFIYIHKSVAGIASEMSKALSKYPSGSYREQYQWIMDNNDLFFKGFDKILDMIDWSAKFPICAIGTEVLERWKH